MNTIMEIIDENKDKLSDGDYLKLCDAIHILYNQKYIHVIETVYINSPINVITDVNNNKNHIELKGNRNKRGILFSI